MSSINDKKRISTELVALGQGLESGRIELSNAAKQIRQCLKMMEACMEAATTVCIEDQEVIAERERRFRAEEELSKYRKHLEELVEERTSELEAINDQLMIKISERKKVEEALRESEVRFRDLAELLPVVVYETDHRLRLTFANNKAFDLFGYSPEDMEVGLDALSMIVPEDRNRVMEIFLRRLQGEELGAIEYTGMKKDGSTFPILLHNVPIQREGNLVGARGIVIDITRQKRAEEKSQNMLNFLQTLINTIPSPIFCKDVNGLYQDCNKEFEDYAGFKKEDIVGKSVYDMYPRGVADKYHEKDLALFAKPGRQIYEHPITYADGSLHDVIVNKATYLNADGTLAGLVGVMVDITERKGAERERYRNEKLQGVLEMAGAVCHELNQPMQIISGYSELLLTNTAENEPIQVKIATINKQIQRMGDILEKLMKIRDYETQDYAGFIRIIDISKSSAKDTE